MGGDLVDLRHRPEGPRAVVGGDARQDGDPGHRARCATPACSTRLRRSPDGRPVDRAGRRSSTTQFVAEGWGAARRVAADVGQAGSSAGEYSRDRRVRRRRVRGRQRVRQGRRALPEARRPARLPRVLAQAALRRRRGRARSSSCSAEPGRAPPPPEIDHDAAAPVRVHGPRPRRARQPAASSRSARRSCSSSRCWMLHRRDDGFGRREPQPSNWRRRGLTDGPVPADRRAAGPRRRCSARLRFVASRLLAPRRPSAAKEAPYECGIVPSREPPERFPVRFYLVAMMFIMFDIEIIFLYPFAVDRRRARRVRVLGDGRCSRSCSSLRSST